MHLSKKVSEHWIMSVYLSAICREQRWISTVRLYTA